jgi:Family of unknown function (DUF6428)
MKTQEFIQLLEQNPNLPLFFEYEKGAFTRSDYHITEIKNVSFDTVDCGGIQNQWQETHVQLWENESPEPHHSITTTKALQIFNVVNAVRPTFKEVTLKFEYGNPHFHTAILPVIDISVFNDKMIVQLMKDITTCKAKDRAATPEEKAGACCAPTATEKPKLKLAELQHACCGSNSECC